MGKLKYDNPEYYVNRELSWLLFDRRVMSEAKDKNNPLFERLKFLSITSSNLDEFFMVRVASLKDMVNAGYDKKDIAGMTPKEQLKQITKQTHDLVEEQYRIYNHSLLPQLKINGVRVIKEHEQLSEPEAEYVDRYYEENIYPVLTPMAVDSSRPFPLVRNKSLNIGALIYDKKKGVTDRMEKKFWNLQRFRCRVSFQELLSSREKKGSGSLFPLKKLLNEILKNSFLIMRSSVHIRSVL